MNRDPPKSVHQPGLPAAFVRHPAVAALDTPGLWIPSRTAGTGSATRHPGTVRHAPTFNTQWTQARRRQKEEKHIHRSPVPKVRRGRKKASPGPNLQCLQSCGCFSPPVLPNRWGGKVKRPKGAIDGLLRHVNTSGKVDVVSNARQSGEMPVNDRSAARRRTLGVPLAFHRILPVLPYPNDGFPDLVKEVHHDRNTQRTTPDK